MRGKILLMAGLVSVTMFAAPAFAQDYQQDESRSATRSNELYSRERNLYDQTDQIEEEQDVIQVYKGTGPKKTFGYDEPGQPMSLEDLQNVEKEEPAKTEKGEGIAYDLRKEAIKEAAVSFGARGGLAWRTYHISKELEERARQLDKVYDFRQLLIPAPSGLLIEPPIVSESLNALIIQEGGQSAAVSDRLYNIVHNAKIVSTSRTWRTYLERDWGEIELPPDILRPETHQERKAWKELVAKGWAEGIAQADEIFQDDLLALMADFQGMVRYRSLLAQGMISPPYALQVDRGVTGGGEEMRIGDRAVQITGVPELITGSDQWQPANR
jgi:defect in organelle trafficking protein DotC